MKKKFILGLTMAVLVGSFAPSFGDGHVAKAAEKKLWNPIPGYDEQRDYFVGRSFKYDMGDITSDQVVNKKVLYLNKPTALYDAADGKPNGMVLAPQTIEYLHVQPIEPTGDRGYFILLDTWAGKKWVKWVDESWNLFGLFPGVELTYPKDPKGESIFNSVSNKNSIPIYNAPGKNGVVEAYVAPQTLKVTSVGTGDDYALDYYSRNAQNGYIGINTWLGERWVKVNDIDTEVLNKKVHPVNHDNEFVLLDSPERVYGFTNDKPAITSQEVFAIERKGTFVKIKTWLGEKWIEADEFIEGFNAGDTYKANHYGVMDSGVLENAVYYDNANFNTPLEKVNKTGMNTFFGVLHKQDGETWVYADSGKWISSKDITPVVGLYGTIENKQNLKRYYADLYHTEGELAPQKLSVSKKFGEWYQVNGLYGGSWIHPEQGDVITIIEVDYNLATTAKLYKSTSTHESQYIEDVTPQVVKKVGDVQIGAQKWIEVKIPATGKQGFILEK
ncbi:hypothetical protein bcgnr5372_27120 [Bacillus luti]|nr:hypothetical protein [Bacillus cereus]HDR8329712.1 hypothetical protein [Bacillus cereus]HDR8336571.1 hypothetical protein [Bacillus cereus]